jgi:hypothetical protein
MLSLHSKAWARAFAFTVIAVSLIAAVWVPILLHQRKLLDPPIVVAIILLLLAILPPEIATLRRQPHQTKPHKPPPHPAH